MRSVLFVCLGNICRSPTAEGVTRALLRARGLEDRVVVDSAGTGDWHVGAPPDDRAVRAAAARGVDISALRARQVAADDFQRFELILAMDRENLGRLQRLAPRDRRGRIRLILDFAPGTGARDVPDPYFGGSDGFEQALNLIEAAARGLVTALDAGDA